MRSDADKQIAQANPQSFGDLFDVDQGQVPYAALNRAVRHIIILSQRKIG